MADENENFIYRLKNGVGNSSTGSQYNSDNQNPPVDENMVNGLIAQQMRNQTERMVMANGDYRSQNFLTGSFGWQIDSQGNAEFNNGTFRGTFTIGGTLVTVSNITNLATAISTVSTAGGGTVALVPGTYSATQSYSIPSNVTIDGNGATIDFGGGAYQFLIQGTNAYSTGTLAVNFGSGSVVGTGTTWTAAMVGRSILIGDYWYDITARTDNTHITISPNFMAPNISGVTYVIATTVDDVVVKNINLTNSSITALKYRYVQGLVLSALGTTDSAQGIDGDDASGVLWVENSFIDNCVVGFTADNTPFASFSDAGITNITGGTALALNKVSNTSMGVLSVQSVVGVGVSLTSCYNLGFINYSIIECTSHAMEFVSGNSAMDIESGYIDKVGGDGIKLTASSDTITMGSQFISNYTGYGINIAASSCDNNVIISPSYGGGGSGTLNDSGTGTIILPDDTAYGASWNGSLGAPTKNAVYDKIQTLSTTPPTVKVFTALSGTFTVTLASPAVFSKTAHGFVLNDAVVFSTTGALPTGITGGTAYYVISAGLTADAFEVSASLGGSAVNTSGSQSGTHTIKSIYIKPAGLTVAIIEIVGGGGGGGTGSSANPGSSGGGGGGGGYCRKLVATASLSSAETVTIGAGGAAGTNSGVTSSFTVNGGSTLTAVGGSGGASGGGAGGAGGTASNGDLNVQGGGGGGAGSFSGNFGGHGGSSFWGGGAAGGGATAGGNYGGGGSGASHATSGAAGSGGVAIITEYY